MQLSHILKSKTGDLVTVTPETSIAILAHRLAAAHIGAAPVLDPRGALRGIISERDIARALPALGKELGDTKVADLMSTNVVTCSPDTSVAQAMRLMTVHRIRHLPVIEQGRLIGIVSIGDVIKNRLEDMELEANVLRDALIAAH